MPLQVIIGPFHPHLENALLDEIRAHKKADLLCPLMVLVPSDFLLHRVKTLLAREHRLNLLNLHLLTFHQLSLRLFEERHGVCDLELRDDAFGEEALRLLIPMEFKGNSTFSGLDEREGGCAALWQTLRDLKDGLVDPTAALEALNEGHFGSAGREKLLELFSLYKLFRSRAGDWRILDYTDLDTTVVEQIPVSGFLRQFSRIFYFGFYDLTQIQVELFHAVARHYPTALLFPLVHGHPGWAFAERFYERYVQGLVSDSSGIRNLAGDSELLPLFVDDVDEPRSPVPGDFRCTMISCFGAQDEVVTAAKEVLRLVSDEGTAFREIGVVARNLEAYIPWIKEVFTEHRIPITTSAQEPLVQLPLAKAVLLLLNVGPKDFLRSHFIDLISSPFFDARSFCPEGITPRPDLWDLLTRRLGITKGLEEWHRLERHFKGDVVLAESNGEDEDSKATTVSVEQLRILWNLFTELSKDLSFLPAQASWSSYVGAWKSLLHKYLGIAAEQEETRVRSREEQAGKAILDTLDALAGLDAVNPEISLNHFIQTCCYWLERSSIAPMDWNMNGVAVMDVMAARGVPFRALFVLGLNEGVFPRTIREDAFLRDRHRRVLETVLGYKVSEKLAAFDEEKLLFTLLVGAAGERLYCLYQRLDESGRALAPSWYLAELRRALGGKEEIPAVREMTIPRGVMEKQGVEPFNRSDLLLPQELAVSLSLKSQDPMPLVELFSPWTALYKRGRRAMEQLEATGGRLGNYDGALGPLSDCWNRLCKQGVSPTALERYGLCPFQFFARNILRLGRLEQPEQITGLSPSDVGRLGHLILKSFYQELMDRGYFASNDSVDVRSTLERLARKVFSDYELQGPVGYPVAWEILQEGLIELLVRVVSLDLQNLSQTGYRPVALEIETEDSLPGNWPASLRGLSIRGRLDRIDHRSQANLYRVIDYKFKAGRNRFPEDNDLPRSALRGQRLQPPLYLLMGRRFAADREEADPTVEAAFYFLAPEWPDGPLVTRLFPAEAWQGPLGLGLKETLSLLLEGIRQGRFFIHPGSYCDRCEVSEVCRRNHLPTFWRAESDPVTRPYRNLRQKNVPKKSPGHVERTLSRRKQEP